MGFKLECPNCGSRSYHEFWFGGELRAYAPDYSDEQDYTYTWLRTNAKGVQQERWFHNAGCGRWLTVTRDTRDNTFGRSVAVDCGSLVNDSNSAKPKGAR